MNWTRKLGRSLALAAVAALGATMAAPSSPARAGEPLRSGTIVGGASETPVNPWVRGMEGCVGALTCSTWLQSGCAPGLAGADPALQAAIVDVADLADGVTTRSLEGAKGYTLEWDLYVVQFWTRSDAYDVADEPAGLDGEWCWELVTSRLTSAACDRSASAQRCTFRIPAAAQFMTITSRLDKPVLDWTLS